MSDTLLLAAARRALATGQARELRERARVSQIEVGRECYVTAQAVARWESGQRVPRGEPALRYARLLVQLGLVVPDELAESA